MTKRDLVEIIFKIFGIYTFILAVEIIGMSFTNISQALSFQRLLHDGDTSLLFPIIYPFGYALIFLLLTYFFIYKSDSAAKIIMKSDDEKVINISLSAHDLIFVSVAIAGVFTLVSSLPALLNDGIMKLYILQQKRALGFDEFKPAGNSGTYILYHLIQAILGLVLIINSKKISGYIISRQKEEEEKKSEDHENI